MTRRWTIFGLCTALFLMSMLYRSSNAVIAPMLIRDLGLDYDDLGLLGAVFFYVFALVQLPMGLILDRIGPRATITALNLTATAGAVIFALSEGLAGGVMGRALLGLGMAANLMGPLKLYTAWFKPKVFATLIGITTAVGYLGAMLATSPLALLTEAVGWRVSFFLLAGLNLALSLAIWLLVSNRPSGTEGRPVDPPPRIEHPVRILAASRTFRSIAATAFLRYGSFAAIQTLWAGPFLIDVLNLSPVAAGHLLLALNVGFICGAPAGGVIADRWLGSRKRTVQIGLAVLGVTVVCLALWPAGWPVWWLGGLFFVSGFFNSWTNIIYAHVKEAMPQAMSGTAMTGANFFTMIGGGVFIHGLGGILARFTGDGRAGEDGYRLAFLVCAAAVGLALAAYAFSREKRRTEEPISHRVPG